MKGGITMSGEPDFLTIPENVSAEEYIRNIVRDEITSLSSRSRREPPDE